MQTTELAAKIIQIANDKPRCMIAVAGPPASGKSTLADKLAQTINQQCGENIGVVVPMDGFHLANDTLDQRDLRRLKGAPETFDAEGFVELIRTLKTAKADVAIPVFDRTQDAVLPAASTVSPEQRILLIEGNYLLLKQQPWAQLQVLFDYSIALNPGMDVLEQRLIQRWLEHGYSAEEARQKAELNDLPNARTVVEQSVAANQLIA